MADDPAEPGREVGLPPGGHGLPGLAERTAGAASWSGRGSGSTAPAAQETKDSADGDDVIKVLLVDDDPYVRHGLRTVLLPAGRSGKGTLPVGDGGGIGAGDGCTEADCGGEHRHERRHGDTG
ncbi:hypothetical protein [Streptomyces sp. NPDC005262]|uniref:hypothetical protein n=1 Tax=Streptomyces sp. NPDC005262 TaxID=3364710 RepID=UPI0036AF53CA